MAVISLIMSFLFPVVRSPLASSNYQPPKIIKTEMQKVQKGEISSEISPNGKNEILLYEAPFENGSEREYWDKRHLYTIRNLKTLHESEIYVGNYKTDDPHWLGNNHILFSTGCGTACRGYYLVDIRSKEKRSAVLTFLNTENGLMKTNFRDWFGNEFEFTGQSIKFISS